MKKRLSSTILIIIIALIPMSAFAQLGIKAGVNLSQEIRSFNSKNLEAAFDSKNLTGYTVGLVYQINPERSGFGFDFGALLSQKGGEFKFKKEDGVLNSLVKGYNEVNYIDIPVNLRYRISIGLPISFFGTAGLFGSYALNGKTVFESDIIDDIKKSDSFDSFASRIDYGYSLGLGVELISKIQIGVNWSEGLQKKDANKGFLEQINSHKDSVIPNVTSKSNSRVFSVSLTYLF